METLFDKNGLIFWTQEQIQLRRVFQDLLVTRIHNALLEQNSAFRMIQVEAPLLTPKEFINPNYTDEDVYRIDDFVLRPETTAGSFIAANALLDSHNAIKTRPPVVVWQHGKSFRREQDQPLKHMRLKEFYQLEFQIIFTETTKNDYSVKLYPRVQEAIESLIGECRMEPSDRLPSYSEETIDIVCEATDMEVCSMSKRNDLEGYKVIEVAIGTDRLLFNRK
jgi:glycyl-tRNA synthetase